MLLFADLLVNSANCWWKEAVCVSHDQASRFIPLVTSLRYTDFGFLLRPFLLFLILSARTVSWLAARELVLPALDWRSLWGNVFSLWMLLRLTTGEVWDGSRGTEAGTWLWTMATVTSTTCGVKCSRRSADSCHLAKGCMQEALAISGPSLQTIWGDYPPPCASQSLHATIHRMRS